MNGPARITTFLLACSLFASSSDAQVSSIGNSTPPRSSQRSSALAENDLDRLVAKLDAEENSLKTQVDAIGPELDIVRRRIIARGRAYYRVLRAGFLPVGGGFEALVDHAARVERTRLALERDIARETELVKRAADLADRLTRVRAERAPLEVHREAMNRARSALAQEEERQAAFTRAFESSARPDYLAIYGADTGPTEPDGRSGFRALKGRLPFPIAGRAEVRKVHSDQGPALELAAPIGTPVRSVAAGRVAFADTYANYGLTVILDHGDRYYSVYAHLGTADVRVSDQVPSGSRLGTVGSSPNGPHILLELRKGADTVSPGEWFGL